MFNIDTAVNRKEGTRSYAATAYLRDPKSPLPQPNLVVLEGYYATELMFDPRDSTHDLKVVGLKCLRGVDWKVSVTPVSALNLTTNKEIIVSAGELDSASIERVT